MLAAFFSGMKWASVECGFLSSFSLISYIPASAHPSSECFVSSAAVFSREGDPTDSLGSLFQGSITLRIGDNRIEERLIWSCNSPYDLFMLIGSFSLRGIKMYKGINMPNCAEMKMFIRYYSVRWNIHTVKSAHETSPRLFLKAILFLFPHCFSHPFSSPVFNRPPGGT